MSRYDDIMDLPRPRLKHARMPVADRAAQFSPFAALTGHEAAIRETARLTDARAELDASEQDAIARSLRAASEGTCGELTVTWFCPDARKEGGEYRETRGLPCRVDEFSRQLVMADGTCIAFDDILSVVAEAGEGEFSPLDGNAASD